MDVTVCQVQNIEDMGTGDKPEKPHQKEMRLAMYDDIIQKEKPEAVLAMMKNIKNKDEVFCFFDLNGLYKIAEQCLKMGFKNGNFPLKEDRELESNREAGQELVEKYYKNLNIIDFEQFSTIDEGIAFIDQSPDQWALKSCGDDGDTVVPRTPITQFNHNAIKRALKKDKGDYEQQGFILQKRLLDAYEITPEAIWYNGKLVCASIDLESKPRGPFDTGAMCDCSMNLIIKISEKDPIFDMYFPKYIQEMAKKRIGLFIWDAGSLWWKKPNASLYKAYFTEFCSNRFGWFSLITEMAMAKSATDYIQDIVDGKNPLIYKFGVAITAQAPNDNKHKLEKETMEWLESVDKDVWVQEMKKDEGGDVINATNHWDKAVFTGQGNTIQEAVDRVYDVAEKFYFNDYEYRGKEDFLSHSYTSSIMNRYDFLKKQGLIKTPVLTLKR